MRDRGKGSGLDRMRHAATELIGFPRTLAAAAVWSLQFSCKKERWSTI